MNIDRDKWLLIALNVLCITAKVIGILLLCSFKLLCLILIFIELDDDDDENGGLGAHYNIWSGEIDPVKHHDGIYFDD